jgi:hypothetical protein
MTDEPMTDLNRFKHVRFDDFRRMAQDSTLSEYEKIAFPDSYRAGYGDTIFADIRRKLTHLDKREQTILEIGPGCSDPAHLMINLCRQQGHTLILVDAAEMLALLPDEPFIVKIAAYFPDECQPLFDAYTGKIDVINCYSLLHTIFAEGNIYRFLDQSLTLLAEGGQFMIGDIPNISKRKRFFSSETGIRFHQNFMHTSETPSVQFNMIEAEQIDDAVLLSLLMRARAAGFDSYLLPQSSDLPMANRREDLLICKP